MTAWPPRRSRIPEGPVRARLRRSSLRKGAVLALVAGLAAGPAGAEPIRIKVLGGLDGVSQYSQFEEPFWRRTVPVLTGGQVEATIQPFDRSGLRSGDMLQLMRLGVVPFGTALLAVAAADEPELNALDLPALNPDFPTFRIHLGLYREHVRTVLRERYDIELLGLYAYPAQVVFCAKPFTGLTDLGGRRVRTSSVGQSELMRAVGAVPVMLPFGEIVTAVSGRVVDCAITGTLSGHEIGLSRVTSHVHAMALSWGLSIFGANRAAWDALPVATRETLRGGVTELEGAILQAAERETEGGLACDAGLASCRSAKPPARMTVVQVNPDDDARRRELLVRSVLPAWVDRCGDACVRAWNLHLAPALGIVLDEAPAR